MSDFNSIFPNFTNQCLQLKQILTPIAYLLIVAGLISSTVTGQRSGDFLIRSFGRTLLLIVILSFLVSWGNTVSTTVDSTVKNVLKVDPTKIYDQYQSALQVQKSPANTNQSWWDKMFNFGATMFEAIISACLWLLGLIANGIVFYAYIIQKIILFTGYALAPIFIGFLAFGSLFDIGKRYLLHLVGVMLWPLGWGVAGLVTQGLIDFMTDQSFLHSGGFSGFSGYTFQNFLGLGTLAIWLIFSTIAAPVIIEKSLSGGFVAGAALLSGAAQAGKAAVGSALITGTSVAATSLQNGSSGDGDGQDGGGQDGGGGSGQGGGSGTRQRLMTAGTAALAGMATGAAAGLESLMINSAGMGSDSLVGSLASMRSSGGNNRSRPNKKSNGKVENPSFPADDLTGDKTVAEMLKQAKEPDSQK